MILRFLNIKELVDVKENLDYKTGITNLILYRDCLGRVI